MTPPKIPVSTDYATPTGYSPYYPVLNAATGGTLQLDKSAAQQAAAAAGTMLNIIYGVQGYVYAAQNISGFGGLPSSSRIADKFNTAANQLGDVLNGHIKILNDLGQTLVIAGNLYQNNEHDSQAMFNTIVGNSEAHMYDTPLHQMSAPATNADPQPGWVNTAASTPNFTRADGYGSLLTVHNSSTGKNTTPVDAENPYHYVDDLGFFYGVHYAIDPQPAAFASADWDYMTKQMTAGATTLVQSISALNSGGAWVGEGATNAVGAGKAYAGTVTNLVNNMDIIRINLDYASGWLTSTKSSLTPLAGQLFRQFTPAEKQQYVSDVLAPNFQSNYVVGINNSSSAIPTLTTPMLPAPPNYVSTTSDPGTTGTGTIPTGGGGNPHGGGGGGGTTGGGGGGSGSGGGGNGGGSGSGGGSDSGGGSGSGSGGGGTGSGGGGGNGGGVGTGGIGSTGTGTGTATGGVVPVGGLGTTSGLGADEYSPQSRAALNAAQEAEEAEQAGNEAMAMEDGMANEAAVAARMAGAAGAEAEALAQDLRLFPRAALAAESEAEAEAAALSRAGAAEGEGEGMGPTAGKRDEEEDEDEYKRADYLSSKKYLDEAIGTGVGVAKPVLTL